MTHQGGRYHDLQQIDSTILREYQQSLIVLAENSGNFGLIFVYRGGQEALVLENLEARV